MQSKQNSSWNFNLCYWNNRQEEAYESVDGICIKVTDTGAGISKVFIIYFNNQLKKILIRI